MRITLNHCFQNHCFQNQFFKVTPVLFIKYIKLLFSFYLLLSTTTADSIKPAPIKSNVPNVVPSNRKEKIIAAIGSKQPIILPVTAPINLTPSKYVENDKIVPTTITPIIHIKSINLKLSGI